MRGRLLPQRKQSSPMLIASIALKVRGECSAILSAAHLLTASLTHKLIYVVESMWASDFSLRYSSPLTHSFTYSLAD